MSQPLTFAAWLRTALDRRSVDAGHLATAIGATPAAVHAWLGGRRPGSPSVVRVLDALAVDELEESEAWRAFRHTVRESM
jgi:hypothetical protein